MGLDGLVPGFGVGEALSHGPTSRGAAWGWVGGSAAREAPGRPAVSNGGTVHASARKTASAGIRKAVPQFPAF